MKLSAKTGVALTITALPITPAAQPAQSLNDTPTSPPGTTGHDEEGS